MPDELLHCKGTNFIKTSRKVTAIEEVLAQTLSKLEREPYQLSAQISELNDRVEKARLRENELAERVTRWVEYLKEEKEKQMIERGTRLYTTGALSANVSDDIAYNIEMLIQMRKRVHEKLQEVKNRKKEHKNQLRQLKAEMLTMHRELEGWDKKYDEIQKLIRRMETSRQHLLERIKQQQQKETASKLACIQLDKKLHELCGNITDEHMKINGDQTMTYHFSMTETESQDVRGWLWPTYYESANKYICKTTKA
ncbi:hypothetical protein DICVIV_07817 [Dictyocaulus viviparus]|uniref:Uncharacterized protein n=1 Tax=Dictyocaulus viviparus TaxID=29172 RepID=A0A0D8XQS8_DICVI|nr:hypothetical protein DICVIV_07817 [Dictyocaulus viviparus]